MMRKFKHKTLGWIAEIDGLRGRIKNDVDVYFEGLTFQSNYTIQIPTALIKNSQDREEVIEKDWKQKIIDDTNKYGVLELRNIIEKHAPKQVKFTRDNIQKWYNNYPSMDGTKMVRDFLKDHNLLDEEPQGETCEHESDGGVYLTLRKEGEEVKPPKSKCKKCGVFYRN